MEKKQTDMTPKEKAEELVIKYLRLNGDTEWFHKVLAKQCALIAVDEILKDKEVIDGIRVINDPYWIEVKQEIENL